jgi:beta-1,4-mannosyl-glycoprotein beta-1,4-N-acetylglucosaminyltransferase
MKIIDCFTFYNELELLNYRLNLLKDVVDYFIIVESTHTHVGHEKKLYFNENQNLFLNFKDKIIHIIVDDFKHKQPNVDTNKGEQWVNEKHQRNCIKRGLEKITLDDNDIIVITDLDEVPDPNTLLQIKITNEKIRVCSLEQDLYYYNLNTRYQDKWYKAKIISYAILNDSNITCDDIRMQINNPIIKKGGWHLSYFGDKYFIQNKLQEFTHQEFNDDRYTNVYNIQKNIDSNSDLFGRHWERVCRIELKDNNYLPAEYENYLSKFTN